MTHSGQEDCLMVHGGDPSGDCHCHHLLHGLQAQALTQLPYRQTRNSLDAAQPKFWNQKQAISASGVAHLSQVLSAD